MIWAVIALTKTGGFGLEQSLEKKEKHNGENVSGEKKLEEPLSPLVLNRTVGIQWEGEGKLILGASG